MSTLNKTIKSSCLLAIVIGSAVGPSRVFPSNYVLNLSPSMPLGVYRRAAAAPKRGDIVGACVPDSFATLALQRGYLEPGSCSNGTRPVMKYVLALSGDTVEVKENEVAINGDSVPNTHVISNDPHGRAVPNRLGRYTLKDGEYWLLSNHALGSLDSRYFGPVHETLGVVEPFFTHSTLCRFEFYQTLSRC